MRPLGGLNTRIGFWLAGIALAWLSLSPAATAEQVFTTEGSAVGCVAWTSHETKSLFHVRRVHAVTCFDFSTSWDGVVPIVGAMLNRKGKIKCEISGGYLPDPPDNDCFIFVYCGRVVTFGTCE